MNWKNLTARFKVNKSKPLLDQGLDRRLLKNVKKKFLPNWSQIKYLRHFLNSTEKKLVVSLTLIISIAAVIWLATFLSSNIYSAPNSGGEYSEAMIGQPKYINPLFSSTNDIDSDLVSLIYSGLFKRTNQEELVPELAASYTISQDQKIYEINLRDDLVWSDGEPFKSADVLFTFEAVQNPEVGSPLFSSFQGVKIEATDSNKISFTLPEPFSNFLSSLTVGILPEHIWAKIPPASMKLAKHNIQPIGTGPWMFNKLTKDDLGNIQTYTLIKNERFWKNKPYLENLTFKFFGDFAPAAEALRSQNVLAISFVPHQYQERLESKKLINYSISLPQYTALFLNQVKQPFLKDEDLRQSLALAIDKQKIVNQALKGRGSTISSPLISDQNTEQSERDNVDINAANTILDKNWERVQPEEYFNFRRDQTMKDREEEINELKETASSTPDLLAERLAQIDQEIAESVRGEMHRDQIFYRKNKDSEILRLQITTSETAELASGAELVAAMWRELGIQTGVVTVPNYQITRETIRAHEYEVLLYGVIVGSNIDPYPFWHSSQREYPGLNLSLYSNRSADKLLEDARATTDPNKISGLYSEFQKILDKDRPAIFLYTPTYIFYASKELKGINFGRVTSPEDRYSTLHDWYINTKWRWN